MRMDLSIVIVNYNTKSILRDCLNSIREHAAGFDYEVIVVDNASSDGSLDMLRQEFSWVKRVASADNSGFAGGNNQGIRVAQGRYIVLLNSDTLLKDNCFKLIIDFLDKREDIGVLGCKILNTNGTFQHSCWRRPGFWSELMLFTKAIVKDFWDPFTYFKFMKDWNHNSLRDVYCVSGCCLLARKEVFTQAGLLDEDFFMYYEDFEFCERVVKKTKYRVVYFPDASLIHLGQMSANAENFSFVKNCFASIDIYFRKTGRTWMAGLFRLCCKVIWAFEAVIFFLLSFHEKGRKKFRMLSEVIKL